MVKKILFFGIAIIFGFMLLVMCYSGFQMSDVQAKINEYISTNDYSNLSRCFLPYYNANSIKELNTNENEIKVTSLQSIFGVSTSIKVNGEEQSASQYVAGYTFYLQNFKDFDFDGVETDGVVSNYTRIVFLNNDLSYEYYFNDPITATSESADGVNRYYTQYAQSLDFVEIDLSLEIINEKLNGEITGIEIYNGKAAPNSNVAPTLSLDFVANPLTTTGEYFTFANELVEHFDQYLSDLDSDAFSNFFDPAEGEGWLDRYLANDGYARGISSYGDLIGNSAVVKTVVVMIIYLAVCIVLGIFILRNKNKMPKPYLRDQYKKQMVSANSIKAEVVEKPTAASNVETKENLLTETSDVTTEETKVETPNVANDINVSSNEEVTNQTPSTKESDSSKNVDGE